ncbi:MAG: DNA-processing protein DprA [Oligoflexia bacterium]|nr:DNA-processing protein DprA [Oligoflexia bacterium]
MESKKFYVALSCINLPLWFKSRLINNLNFDLASLWKNADVNTGYLEYREKIRNFNDWKSIDRIISEARDKSVGIVTAADQEYPDLLRNIHDFPPVLFTRGDVTLLKSMNISLVGSRNITMYGKSIVSALVPDLVDGGFCTVSGMARGIDAEVHRVTLQKSGKTIAVLGSGLDVIYPVQNRRLFDDIIERGGLVVSEFAFGTQPFKNNFPQRNRIIAGLSRGVVVVEAGHKSGSLITASLAGSYSRDVFAVPGPVNSVFSEGTNNLIKRGAIVTLSSRDIFEHYELLFKSKKPYNINKLTEKARILLKLIDPKGIDLNELLMLSGLPLAELYCIIEELESNKRISRDEFGVFFLT